MYVYFREKDRKYDMEDRETAQGWDKQAIGGDPRETWCYNCSKEGHLGDVSRGGSGSDLTPRY